MCDHSIYILYSRSSKDLQRTLRESSIRPVVTCQQSCSRWVSNDISSILNSKLQSINFFSRMITHFVSSRLYKGTVESKIPGGGWGLFTSRISLIRDILWSRLPLDIYGLFKMVFDCLWVVVDVFGLNTGNTGKPFFKILNGANILPRQPSWNWAGRVTCRVNRWRSGSSATG